MPWKIEIDKQKRLALSTAWGDLSFNDMVAHQAALRAHPDFNPEFDQLLHFTDMSPARPLSAEQIRALASSRMFAKTSRRAIVAPTSFIFGMARMFEAHYSMLENAAQVRVFSDLAAALEWLGKK